MIIAVLLGVCFMMAVTLYAKNLDETGKINCLSGSQKGQTVCCADACKGSNTSQQDIDDCTKDCKDYKPTPA